MIANILEIFNMVAAKQNQKFPFHFLSAPPTPPAENLKERKLSRSGSYRITPSSPASSRRTSSVGGPPRRLSSPSIAHLIPASRTILSRSSAVSGQRPKVPLLSRWHRMVIAPNIDLPPRKKISAHM